MFCIWCFFFFFKQKTAYEMRISDWSSDVCSSDLGRLGLGDGLFRDGRRLTNGWFRSACNAISLERVERMQSLERARPIWPILAAEIGRASCRERVCQYV